MGGWIERPSKHTPSCGPAGQRRLLLHHAHARTHTLFARLLAAQLLVRSILLYESRKLCSGAPNAGLMAAWIGDIYIYIDREREEMGGRFKMCLRIFIVWSPYASVPWCTSANGFRELYKRPQQTARENGPHLEQFRTISGSAKTISPLKKQTHLENLQPTAAAAAAG